ncbi:vitamin K-dependent protein C-like isoform X2 [Anopheles gambiae]|nr:vitamin K-dependent protein C-like isoform X2 [Anopheles gambiae]
MEDKFSFSKEIVTGYELRQTTPYLSKSTPATAMNISNCKPFLTNLNVSNIADHHLCIFHEPNQPWLWNGGLLHVDFIYANRFVPYIIGIDSIKVNKSHKPDVFLQISKFGDWITKTMRDEGEDISFDPLMCAKRHLQNRRQINSTELNVPNKSIRYAVSIQPSPDGHQPKKCAGILLEKDIVVTLAQCASNLMSYYSRVVFVDRSSITIRDIIIHPNYTANSLYNNIAVLKLVSEASFIPAKILNVFKNDGEVILYAGTNITDNETKDVEYLLIRGLTVLLNIQFNPTEEQRARLSKGLQLEHLCLRNENSIVPGSCALVLGSPVEYWNASKYLLGLYMNGENCGFGEPIIVLYVNSHYTWIRSVIEKAKESITFVAPFLKPSDNCWYPDGTNGTCISPTSCSKLRHRIETNLPIFYCQTREFVCCPPDTEMQLGVENDDISFAFYRA